MYFKHHSFQVFTVFPSFYHNFLIKKINKFNIMTKYKRGGIFAVSAWIYCFNEIYISNDIVYQCQQHLYLFTSDAEFSALWVKFKVQAHIVHFCFVYRSPSVAKDSTFNKIDCLSDSISKILKSYPDSEITIELK